MPPKRICEKKTLWNLFCVNMISIFLRSFTSIYISYPNSFPGKRLHERPTSFNFALKTNYVCLRKKAGNKQLIGQLVSRIWLELITLLKLWFSLGDRSEWYRVFFTDLQSKATLRLSSLQQQLIMKCWITYRRICLSCGYLSLIARSKIV